MENGLVEQEDLASLQSQGKHNYVTMQCHVIISP
jgi:hypothetical protein